VVQADPAQWKAALKKCVLFLLLSPFDSEVSDMLQRLKADKKLLALPAAKRLLDQFTTDELMRWPLPDQKEWQTDPIFDEKEKGPGRWEDFHKRVVQHVCARHSQRPLLVCGLTLSLPTYAPQNIRVLAQYYSRISTARMAFFLQIDAEVSPPPLFLPLLLPPPLLDHITHYSCLIVGCAEIREVSV
jgi:26S proteasome regulatory subunit N5